MLPPAAIALVAILTLIVDPLAALLPAIRFSAADRRALDEGRTIARTLDSPADQVAVVAISRVAAPVNTLIDHARAIEDLKRSSFVMAIRRFSDPPKLEDLDQLVLTPRDVDAAIACRPRNCSFKLTAAEIALLHDFAAAGEGDRPFRYRRAFRQVVLNRVVSYLEGGLVLDAQPFNDMPDVAQWLSADPGHASDVESFLYWSYETYGAGKPVVAITHVGLVPSRSFGEPALVLGRQIFASHYMTGGIALTAIVEDPATAQNYLVYINRTGVDLLGGVFGPVKRALLESRLKGQLPEIIAKLRTRLEHDGRTR